MIKYFLQIIAFGVALSIVFVTWSQLCVSKAAFSHAVEKMGYAPEKEPAEIVEFKIPENFNDVYERYNALQKEGGYDLSMYKGKACKRYTYLIKNENARANIIVYKGKIIGGDISSITIDGIMIPLKRGIEDAP